MSSDLIAGPSFEQQVLPPCPRRELVRERAAWFIVNDCPGFTVCPDCYNSVFSHRSLFRKHFQRESIAATPGGIQCSFGGLWMRLAWLLTVARKRIDLTLLKSVAAHEYTNKEPCPQHEAVRDWYTIGNSHGPFFGEDFAVCLSDVRMIELLLPDLRSWFVKLPQRLSPHKEGDLIEHKCVLRTTSERRQKYLDKLVDCHEEATKLRQPPSLYAFSELVKELRKTSECERDTMINNARWHMHPSIPDFTVCSDCYDTQIVPALVSRKNFAESFSRTPRLDPREPSWGNSCQLYSPRVRKIWQDAVEANDLKYMAKKAKERKDAELEWRRSKIKAKGLYRIHGGELGAGQLADEVYAAERAWVDKYE